MQTFMLVLFMHVFLVFRTSSIVYLKRRSRRASVIKSELSMGETGDDDSLAEAKGGVKSGELTNFMKS